MELHPKLHSQGPCGWAASTPPALYRGSMSEHFFISTLGCFYTLPRGCSRQKCRSSLELPQGSCRKASVWRKRSSELAAVCRGGELTQYEKPVRSLAGLQWKITRIFKRLSM